MNASSPTRVGPFDLGRVHVGDAQALIRRLPFDSVGVVVADPPYSSGGAFRGDRMADAVTKYVNTDYTEGARGFTGDNRDQRSYVAWSVAWMTATLDRMVEGGVLAVWTDWRQLPAVTDAVQMAGFVWRGIAAWGKTTARPQSGRPTQSCEFVVWATKGPRSIAGPTCPGWWHEPTPRRDRDFHITPKPVPLLRDLVRLARSGEVVLDPFSGSGSTGVACKLEGIPFVGFELDPHWAKMANGRLGDTAAQTHDAPLFAGVAV